MNHLSGEKSPYLLQHANNPVDWYPWGDAAFAKARAEGKPIFLSVGYSTCHWCHVMAHESFEDERIAGVLNAHYVSVKVDREERPDVDRVYMTFVQATTGSGGWPMSVWLTPQLEPFYGGTYFPPAARWGRPGFVEILEEIARVWREDPRKVQRSAAQLTAQLRQLAGGARGGSNVTAEAAERVLVRAVAEFREAFDPRNGGFGDAPKFPRPSELLFLMHEFARRGGALRLAVCPEPVEGRTARSGQASSAPTESEGAGAGAARDMALRTLEAMARGGIRDHLGGGFHRYSVDARWHVPHFEKMLYDQAQLVLAYLDAFQVSADARFADVAADTLEYVGRDLARPGGGFYSAEDADSLPAEPIRHPPLAPGTRDEGPGTAHSVEGAFYVWSDPELASVLGDDADIARLRFGVLPDGNVESDPQGELSGKNVLYLAADPADLARLDRARQRLFEARARRPRPGLDDKVIVAWNGLMIAAFARASRVLVSVRPELTVRACIASARSAAAFIRDTMWDHGRGRLLRRYRDGEAAIEAYAEDYACLIFGLLELFQADGDPAWLEWAIALQQAQDSQFWDDSAGGWFSTTGRDASVLLRLKEEYDGAEPAASSISAWNLLTLARLTGEDTWAARAERTFAGFSDQLERAPRSMPMMLAALSAFVGRKQELVVVGPEERDDTRALLGRVASLYLPFAVVVPVRPERHGALARVLPFVESMTMRDGRATAYVCQEFACRQPTTDPETMVHEIRLK